jgi:hypothetical protein
MKIDKDLTITNFLICEDIRQENNNKFILIGVFSSSLKLSAIPAVLPISLYIEGRTNFIGDRSLFVKFSGPDEGEATVELGLRITEENEGFLVVAVPKLNISFNKEGSFQVDLSGDGKSWKRVATRKVSLDPTLTPWSATTPELLSEQSQSGALDT